MNNHQPRLLYSQVKTSLQYISSLSPSPPETIRQAQETLLALENDHVDEYVTCLLSLIVTTTSSDDNIVYVAAPAVAAAAEARTLRLAAILTLKAAISRRWKDRGRGRAKTLTTSETGQQQYLSENVKQAVRMCILNLVIAGGQHQQQGARRRHALGRGHEHA